jgi:hypothetical protein
LKNGQV